MALRLFSEAGKQPLIDYTAIITSLSIVTTEILSCRKNFASLLLRLLRVDFYFVKLNGIFSVRPQMRYKQSSAAKARFKSRVTHKSKTPTARVGVLLWRRHPDLNWGIEVLQTFALPLGYGAILDFIHFTSLLYQRIFHLSIPFCKINCQ